MARSFRPSRFGPRSLLRPAQSGYAAWAWAGSLLGILGTLVVYAPAAWLAAGVAQASAGQVQLADARGTVWNGSAQLVLTGGAQSSDASALPERLQWTLRPARAGLHGHILPTCCSQQPTAVRLTAHWGGARLDISALQVKLPAQLLSGLGTPWNTIHPQGQLALNAPAVSLDWVQGRAQLGGSATLDMTDISSRLSTLRPLGDYRLSLTGGAAPSLQLQTLQGALQLSGSGQWVGARMRFSGEASAAPEREAALSNLLNIIGRRQGAKSLISLG